MDKPHALPKSERLSSLTAVRRLFTDGASGFVYPFRYMVLKSESTTPSVEVLFSVPKRNHKRANKRNTLKRRMREAYRLGRETMCERLCQSGKHLQIAFIYSTKESHSYKTISNAVQRILEQVSKAM